MNYVYSVTEVSRSGRKETCKYDMYFLSAGLVLKNDQYSVSNLENFQSKGSLRKSATAGFERISEQRKFEKESAAARFERIRFFTSV